MLDGEGLGAHGALEMGVQEGPQAVVKGAAGAGEVGERAEGKEFCGEEEEFLREED